MSAQPRSVTRRTVGSRINLTSADQRARMTGMRTLPGRIEEPGGAVSGGWALAVAPPAATAAWVPAGRTLHLVDPENLTRVPGSRRACDLVDAADAYALAAGVRDGDHVIVASHPALGVAVLSAFPHARLLFRSGRNGADDALLESADPDDVARRYFQVAIGSGDGKLAQLAQELGLRGVPVVVVARRGRLARRLASRAQRVIFLPAQSESAEGGAA
jgi:hypothetical protein